MRAEWFNVYAPQLAHLLTCDLLCLLLFEGALYEGAEGGPTGKGATPPGMAGAE